MIMFLGDKCVSVVKNRAKGRDVGMDTSSISWGFREGLATMSCVCENLKAVEASLAGIWKQTLLALKSSTRKGPGVRRYLLYVLAI